MADTLAVTLLADLRTHPWQIYEGKSLKVALGSEGQEKPSEAVLDARSLQLTVEYGRYAHALC